MDVYSPAINTRETTKVDTSNKTFFLPKYNVNITLTLPENLTRTELLIFKLLLQGKTVSGIAHYRRKSPKTISYQKHKLYEKLNIQNDIVFWREIFFNYHYVITPFPENKQKFVKDNLDRQYLMTTDIFSRALENDELIPWFQPVVCTSTGVISGCEVFMRWKNFKADKGLPESFISLVESSGLIVPITSRLMTLVSDILMPVKEHLPFNFHVAINVTAECILSTEFEEACFRFIKRFGDNGIRLVLELTERSPIPVTPDICSAFHRLHKCGISIALDDFGTGYNGYCYLQAFPVDLVKLERSFVQKAVTDEISRNIVEGIITLSHKLGLKVIAEGIETKKQADFIKNREVDYLQGYLFSPPVSGELFINEWVKEK